MALETDEGLCLGRKFHDIEKRGGIALDFFFIVITDIIADFRNGEAARPMTGFAVDQRETIIRLYLFAMDTVPEIIGDLLMMVTLGYTIVRSHILRVHPADNQPLVIAHRQNGPVQLQIGTGNDTQGC